MDVLIYEPDSYSAEQLIKRIFEIRTGTGITLCSLRQLEAEIEKHPLSILGEKEEDEKAIADLVLRKREEYQQAIRAAASGKDIEKHQAYILVNRGEKIANQDLEAALRIALGHERVSHMPYEDAKNQLSLYFLL